MRDHVSARVAAVAFAFALVILAQGITAPFVKDAEPQAASWIQDVAGGDSILLPNDYYGELARKPPLFYWTAGAITAITGGHVDEFRTRIVSVIAGAAIAVLVLTWTTGFLGLVTGSLAFLFLLATYAFTSRATLGLEDMMMVAFVFSAWCLIYPMLEGGVSLRTTIEIGVALGLAVLTKGPVAVVLPALAGLIYLVLTRQPILAQLRRPWPWIVFAIAVAIPLPWYLQALLSRGGEVARIIIRENLGHFLPSGVGGTGEAARPFYYIGLKMLGGTTPLNFLLPALIIALLRADFIAETRKPLMFQLSLPLAVLLFFSFAGARRYDYILPAMPGLAIVFAALFTSLADSRLVRGVRNAGAIGVAVLAIVGVVIMAMWIYLRHIAVIDEISPLDRTQADLFVKYYFRALSFALVVLTLTTAGCIGLIANGIRHQHPAQTGAGVGLLSLLGVLIFTASLRPEMARERTLKYAAADINRISSTAPIYVLDENEELSFYLGREAPLFFGPHQLRRSKDSDYLFAYRRDFRGAAAPLFSRSKMVTEWDRAGNAGSPALYVVKPE